MLACCVLNCDFSIIEFYFHGPVLLMGQWIEFLLVNIVPSKLGCFGVFRKIFQ